MTTLGRLLPFLPFVAAPLFCAAASQEASADDVSRGVALPGLQAVPPSRIVTTAAHVELKGEELTVALSLTSSPDAALVIREAQFHWLGEGEPYPDRDFPELTATWNGTRLSLARSAVAFDASRDITADVKAAKLDPLDVTESPPVLLRPQDRSETAFDRLLHTGAIQELDGQYIAHWSVQPSLTFNVGGGDGVLTLHYRARPGYALLPWDQLASWLRPGDYCAANTDELGARLFGGAPPKVVAVQTYSVAVGVNGTAPPSLTVDFPGENAAFCGADGKLVAGPAQRRTMPAEPDKSGVFQAATIRPPN